MSKPAHATDGRAKMSALPTRTIAVLNQKGGVGKTTSTVNLGAALAEAGLRVCMIDMDPQAHLTLHLGITAEQIEHSVYDLLIDPECYASDAIISARPNMDVIVAEVDLAAAETELSQTDDRQTILRRKLETISKSYDVVLIDCPPSLGLLTLNALALATEVFVPMQAHFLALQGVGKLLETVGLVCQSINPKLQVTGIILCMHEAQTTLAKEIVSDLDSFFTAARDQQVPWNTCRVLKPPIRRNVKLAEAPSFGKTIFDYEPGCPGAGDYRLLAQDLLVGWGLAPKVEAPPPVPSPAKVVSAPTAVAEMKPVVAKLEVPASIATAAATVHNARTASAIAAASRRLEPQSPLKSPPKPPPKAAPTARPIPVSGAVAAPEPPIAEVIVPPQRTPLAATNSKVAAPPSKQSAVKHSV